jgi:hypothetical protein
MKGIIHIGGSWSDGFTSGDKSQSVGSPVWGDEYRPLQFGWIAEGHSQLGSIGSAERNHRLV